LVSTVFFGSLSWPFLRFVFSFIRAIQWAALQTPSAFPHLQRSPEGTREISQIQGSALSHAVSNVVADITRREDVLNLFGNAAGTATPVGTPVCYWGTKKTEG
jgi:hypothetical protein